jgi:lactoylglutathione lyase
MDFHVGKMGMKLVGEMHLGTATNYFFAVEESASEPMLELTHNHDQSEPYDLGNGYSHVAFTVDDLEGTVSRLEEQGVEIALAPKTMTVEGHDYRIAFVVDPDGYRIELVERGNGEGRRHNPVAEKASQPRPFRRPHGSEQCRSLAPPRVRKLRDGSWTLRYTLRPKQADVAQQVEQLTRNEQVSGSSPLVGSPVLRLDKRNIRNGEGLQLIVGVF